MAKIYFSLLLFCFSFFSSRSQLIYQIKFEDYFRGIDIYSSIQDKNHVIYFATSEGVFKYSGLKVSKVNIDKTYDEELFGLTFDIDNQLYCHNLQGQIFKINNDSLQLFFQLPDSIKKNDLSFEFDNYNNLIICSKNYYLVKRNKIIKIASNKNHYYRSINKTYDSTLLLVDFENGKLLKWKNERVIEKINLPENLIKEDDKFNFSPLAFNDRIFLVSDRYNLIYHSKSFIEWKRILVGSNKLIEGINIKFLNDSLVTTLGEKNGISFFNFHNNELVEINNGLKDYRISSILNDYEGNFWLSSLKRGVFYVKNIDNYDLTELINPNRKEIIKIIKIEECLYVAFREGKIVKVRGNKIVKELRFDKSIYHFNVLDNQLLINSSIYSTNLELIGENEFRVGNIKKSYFFDSCYLFCSNTGFYIQSKNKVKSIFYKNFERIGRKVDTNKLFFEFSRPIFAHINKKRVLVFSKNEKLIIDLENHNYSIKKLDFSIVNVINMNNNTYAISSSKKLYRYNFDGFIEQKNIDLVNSSNVFALDNNIVLTDDDKGIVIYDTAFYLKNKILFSNESLMKSITQFLDYENKYIISNYEKIYSLSKKHSKQEAPVIFVSKVLVDSKVYSNFELNILPTEKKLQFEFFSTSFSQLEKLKFHYKIDGLNDSWIEMPMNQNVLTINKLPYGSYKLQVYAMSDNDLKSQTLTFHLNFLKPFWLKLWFFCFIGLLFFSIVFLIYKWRLHRIKRKMQIEREIKISQIKALKAQMNPHFFFNTLNSLQDLILHEDIRSSNIYLTKFADLIRNILKFSESEYISLNDEISLIKNYLELEKLRFSDSLSIQFTTNLTPDDEKFEIPSMLLQPLIENAIKHGFSSLEGVKKLKIDFISYESKIEILIEDNGVGLDGNTDINKNSLSFSGRANNNRIQLFNEILDKKIQMEYSSSKSFNSGTLVKLIFTR